MNRDDFIEALRHLYGYDPHDYDGLTLAEVSQTLNDVQLQEVYAYLGVS